MTGSEQSDTAIDHSEMSWREMLVAILKDPDMTAIFAIVTVALIAYYMWRGIQVLVPVAIVALLFGLIAYTGYVAGSSALQNPTQAGIGFAVIIGVSAIAMVTGYVADRRGWMEDDHAF